MPSTALAERPRCASHDRYMELRDPPGGWTREQQWCGIWYDCPEWNGMSRCYSSVLYPSPELLAQNAEMIGRHRASCPGCDLPTCKGTT